jgi:ArsR family transcriptional regulator
MATALPTLSPRTKQAGGCCAPFVESDLSDQRVADLAAVGKAVGDPTRVRIVDVLRKAAPEAVCACELTPLFDMSQPAVSRHLKVLRDAGVIGVERRGLWSYYFIPEGSTLEVLDAWQSK